MVGILYSHWCLLWECVSIFFPCPLCAVFRRAFSVHKFLSICFNWCLYCEFTSFLPSLSCPSVRVSRLSLHVSPRRVSSFCLPSVMIVYITKATHRGCKRIGKDHRERQGKSTNKKLAEASTKSHSWCLFIKNKIIKPSPSSSHVHSFPPPPRSSCTN